MKRRHPSDNHGTHVTGLFHTVAVRLALPNLAGNIFNDVGRLDRATYRCAHCGHVPRELRWLEEQPDGTFACRARRACEERIHEARHTHQP